MENNDYNLNDEPNLPLDDNDKHLFGLPLDYFASFEDKLRKKLESQEELNEFPVLSSIPKTNLFTTPADYFSITENTLGIEAELSAYPQLQSIKTLVTTELELDYVNHLKSSVNYKIELAEELKEYKMLYSIDKVNPFITSEAYFDSITERIKEKIYTTTESKVPILNSLIDFIFGKKIAFTFGLVTVISLFFYFNESPEKSIEIGDCKTLACLERQEILNNNKVISNFDEDQLMDLVDVNKLNQQLNSKKESHQGVTKTDKINVDSISNDDLLDEL